MNSDEPITCRDTTWLVSEARDHELSAKQMKQLHQHIKDCPHCKIASQQFATLFSQLDMMFARKEK